MITEISKNDVLSISRKNLGIGSNSEIDDIFLSCLIRRAASIFCPCAPTTLRQEVLSSLRYLHSNDVEISEQIENIIEGLTVAGDLLELSQVTIEYNSEIKGTWIFSASPSFIERPSGSIFLTGITPDEINPLPEFLSSRIIYEGCTRYIRPQESEDIASVLRGLGIVELTSRAWLKCPKQESATDFYQGAANRLMQQPLSGDIKELTILDSGRKQTYYKDRWITPKKETGNFIARRLQDYGSAIWCFAMLEDGMVKKFIDFPFQGKPWRGCDFAWHLQMAIDSELGLPQRYRLRDSSNDDGVYIDFFSPLPLWAQRRLAILGRPMPKQQSLFTYWLPRHELPAEEKFLQDNLWLARTE